MHWPSTVPAGTHDGLTSSLDLLPTIWAAAGVSKAAAEPQAHVGNDLVSLAQDTPGATPHSSLYWRRAVAAAAREGDRKLIRITNQEGSLQPPILVNLATDPGELVNLAAMEPDRRDALMEQHNEWEKSLVQPRWLTGEVWRDNQRYKHQPDVLTRAQERKLP